MLLSKPILPLCPAPYDAPIAARDYVRRFTEPAMSGACSGLKIVNMSDLPDVEQLASLPATASDRPAWVGSRSAPIRPPRPLRARRSSDDCRNKPGGPANC